MPAAEAPGSGIERQILRILRTASSDAETTAARVAALRSLQQLLASPRGAAHAQPRVAAYWAPLLQLLQRMAAADAPRGQQQGADDAITVLRDAVAGVLGYMGALAARSLAGVAFPAGLQVASPGLLFDWALPVLRPSTGGGSTSVALQRAALLALASALAHADSATAGRYGVQVFEACRLLLEDEATPARLLPALLQALDLACPVAGAELSRHFGDLVDLLLGWSLEPQLPAEARPLLERALMSLRSCWQERPDLASGVARNLAADLTALAAPDTAPTADGRTRFLALAGCYVAVTAAAAGGGRQGLCGRLDWLVGICQSAYDKYLPLGASFPVRIGTEGGSVSMVTGTEICKPLLTLFAAAVAAEDDSRCAAREAGGKNTAAEHGGGVHSVAAIAASSGNAKQRAVTGTGASRSETKESGAAARPGVSAASAAQDSSHTPSERVECSAREPGTATTSSAAAAAPVAAAGEEQACNSSCTPQQGHGLWGSYLKLAGLLQHIATACGGDTADASAAIQAHHWALRLLMGQQDTQRDAVTASEFEEHTEGVLGPASSYSQYRLHPHPTVVQHLAELHALCHILASETVHETIAAAGGVGCPASLIPQHTPAGDGGGGDGPASPDPQHTPAVGGAAGGGGGRASPNPQHPAAAAAQPPPTLLDALLSDLQAAARRLAGSAANVAGGPSAAQLSSATDPQHMGSTGNLQHALTAGLGEDGAGSSVNMVDRDVVELVFGLRVVQRVVTLRPALRAVTWRALLQLVDVQQGVTGLLGFDTAVWLAALDALRAAVTHIGPAEVAGLLLPLLHRLAVDGSSRAGQIAALQWLQQLVLPQATAAATPATSKASRGPHVVDSLCPPPRSSDAALAVAAVRSALAAAGAIDPGVRLAAAHTLHAALPAASGQLPAALALQVVAVACDRTQDSDPETCAVHQKLLAGCAHSLAEAADRWALPGALQRPLEWVAHSALMPQERGFRPSQLSQFLSWLALGPSPPSSSQQQTQQQQAEQPAPAAALSMERLLYSLPLLPPATIPGMGMASPGALLGSSSSSAQYMSADASSHLKTAWQLVQEAAKHCTAARMRTHYGGPAQSFAALERLLQGLHAKSSQEVPVGGAPVMWRVWMAVEFLMALEANIHAAARGSSMRPLAPASACAFFAANIKVCEDWFARTRPLLLAVAVAGGAPHQVVAVGSRRLIDLRRQIKAIQQQQQQQQHQKQQQQQQASENEINPSAKAAAPARGKGKAAKQGGGQAPRVLSKPAHSRQPQQQQQPVVFKRRSGHDPPPSEAAAEGSGVRSGDGGPATGRQQQEQDTSKATALPQQQLQRIGPELQELLRHLCGALCTLRQPDAVQGLRSYCRAVFAAALSAPAARGGEDGKPHGTGGGSEPAASGDSGSVSPLDWMRGAELQAACSYEEAAAEYGRQLRGSAAGLADVGGSGCSSAWMMEQAVGCYCAVSDWSRFRDWQREFQGAVAAAGERGSSSSSHLDDQQLAAVECLAAYDREQYTDAQQLLAQSTWSAAGLPPAQAAANAARLPVVSSLLAIRTDTLSNAQRARLEGEVAAGWYALAASGHAAAVAALQGPECASGLLASVECLRRLRKRVKRNHRDTANGHRNRHSAGGGFLAVPFSPCEAALGWLPELPLAQDLGGGFGDGSTGGGQLWGDVGTWTDLLRVADATDLPGPGALGAGEGAPGHVELLLQVAGTARHTGNLEYASRLLEVAGHKLGGTYPVSGPGSHTAAAANGKPLRAELLLQRALVLRHGGDAVGAAALLWGGVLPYVHAAAAAAAPAAGGDMSAMAAGSALAPLQLPLPEAPPPEAAMQAVHCLTAACSLSDVRGQQAAALPNALALLPALADALAEPQALAAAVPSALADDADSMQPLEVAELACLRAATAAAPGMAAAWRAYGDWLYEHGGMGGAAHEQALFPDDETGGNGGTGGGGSNEELTGEVLAAYCAALACDGANTAGGGGAGGGGGGASVRGPASCGPALLRVLDLLLLCPGQALSPGVEASLRRHLPRVPLASWQPVTNQLLGGVVAGGGASSSAALAGELLLRVAGGAPWAVLYPVLAAVRDGAAAPAEGGRVHEVLERCLAACDAQQPGVVAATRGLVKELARATVLWHEEWHALLSEVQVDVSRRMVALQAESVRLLEHTTLTPHDRQRIMEDRYMAVMSPVVMLLQRRLHDLERRAPATPAERHFLSAYLQPLHQGLSALSAPADALAAPQSAWEPLQHLVNSLGKQLRQWRARLEDISPALAQLQGSCIPMPGVYGQPLSSCGGGDAGTSGNTGSDHGALGGVVTVACLGRHVTILSTKTRPKRLAMLGSNGRRYTYLLKGRDDVRRDERLMQLLAEARRWLAASPAAAERRLEVRCLRVTPLGPRAGLIQWLDNTVPLYGMYTAWWQRRAERAQQQAQRDAAAGAGAPDGAPAAAAVAVPRPTELFQSRLAAALQEAGMSALTPRRKVPLPVLRRVLWTLASETPRGLLADEVWAGSACASDWWRRQQAYAQSTAVMSMVGYLIGLGDRHPDNILMDRASCEVVHIDFGVVFGKGMRLRVPEIVPFRLTHTMVAALGVTGVEGSFRGACQASLRALRGGPASSSLHLLLRLLLRDPQVDWREDRHDAATRKDLELAGSLNLFLSRSSDLGVRLGADLQQLAAVSALGLRELGAFAQCLASLSAASALAAASRRRASEAAAVISSAAAQEEGAAGRLAAAQRAVEQLAGEARQCADMAAGVLQECLVWEQRHQHVVRQLRSEQPPQELRAPQEVWCSADARPLLGLVGQVGGRGHGSGGIIHLVVGRGAAPRLLPAPLLDRCLALDRSGSALLAKQDAVVAKAMASLQEYSIALSRLLPDDVASSSHHARWAAAFSAALDPAAAQGQGHLVHSAAPLAPGPDDPAAVSRLVVSLFEYQQQLRGQRQSMQALAANLEARNGRARAVAEQRRAELLLELPPEEPPSAAAIASASSAAFPALDDAPCGGDMRAARAAAAATVAEWSRQVDALAAELRRAAGGAGDGAADDPAASATGEDGNGGAADASLCEWAATVSASWPADGATATAAELRRLHQLCVGADELARTLQQRGLVAKSGVGDGDVGDGRRPDAACGWLHELRLLSQGLLDAATEFAATSGPELLALVRAGASPAFAARVAAVTRCAAGAEAAVSAGLDLEARVETHVAFVAGYAERRDELLGEQEALAQQLAEGGDQQAVVGGGGGGGADGGEGDEVVERYAVVSASLAALDDAWAQRGNALSGLQAEARAVAAQLGVYSDAAQAVATEPDADEAADNIGVRVVADVWRLLAPLQQRCTSLSSTMRMACPESSWGQPEAADDLQQLPSELSPHLDAVARLRCLDRLLKAIPAPSAAAAPPDAAGPPCAAFLGQGLARMAAHRLTPALRAALAALASDLAPGDAAAAAATGAAGEQGLGFAADEHQQRRQQQGLLAGTEEAGMGAEEEAPDGLPELVPFSGFGVAPTSGDGALEPLEGGSSVGGDEDSGGDGGGGASKQSLGGIGSSMRQHRRDHRQHHAPEPGALPELVRFSAFDDWLEGAGEALEEDGAKEEEEELQAAANGNDTGSGYDALDWPLEEEALDSESGLEAAGDGGGSSFEGTSAAPASTPASSPPPDPEAIKRVQRAMEEHAAASGLAGVLATLRGACEAAAASSAQHTSPLGARLAQHAWMHDPVLASLAAAGVLPEGVASLAGRRAEFLQSLQGVLTELHQVDDEVAGWERASSSVEAQLQAQVQAVEGPPRVRQLQNYLSSRREWLSSSQAHAGGVARLAQAVAQLEASRDGAFWDVNPTVVRSVGGGGAGASSLSRDHFAGHRATLQRLLAVSQALVSGIAEEQVARQQAEALQRDAAQALLDVEQAAADEAAAAQQSRSAAPAAVDAAARAADCLNGVCGACHGAGALVADLQRMLTELLDVTKGARAARDVHQSVQRLAQQVNRLQQRMAAAPAVLDPLAAALREGLTVAAGASKGTSEEVQKQENGNASSSLAVATGEVGVEKGAAAAVLQRVEPMLKEAQLEGPAELAQLAEHIPTQLQALAGAVSSVAASIQVQQQQQEQPERQSHVPQPRAAEGERKLIEGELIDPGVGQQRPEEGEGAAAAQQQRPEEDGATRQQQQQERRRQASLDPERRAYAERMYRAFCAKLRGERPEQLQQQQPSAFASRASSDTAGTAGTGGECGTASSGGSSGGSGRSMGVAEQVDWLLRQATSTDNLCQMFEGWSPWV